MTACDPPGACLQVLCLNQGSSSLKYGLYRIDAEGPMPLALGEASHLAEIKASLELAGWPAPKAIGHRIVHGGLRLTEHCLIDDEVLSELEAATHFAPLHNGAAITLIRQSLELYPAAFQVACFDTQFHRGLPDIARVLPIPRHFEREGIRRYGFHGLSCRSILAQLGRDMPSRLVIAHLGSGASTTAVHDGRSIDTSMGLTPNGGMIMGTRSGDLDPGVVLFMLRDGRFDAATLETFLDRQCGLLGISGLSGDMRVLRQAAADRNPQADLAVKMFCRSVQKQIVAMVTALGGIDTLVFTGGIGEHDPSVRAEVCQGLEWTGARLDPVRNAQNHATISASASAYRIQVVNSKENESIALAVHALAVARPDR